MQQTGFDKAAYLAGAARPGVDLDILSARLDLIGQTVEHTLTAYEAATLNATSPDRPMAAGDAVLVRYVSAHHQQHFPFMAAEVFAPVGAINIDSRHATSESDVADQ